MNATEALERLYRLADPDGRADLIDWSTRVIEQYERRSAGPLEVERLTDALALRAREFADLLAADLHISLNDDVMLRIDARHADYADRLGQDDAATEIREQAEARWERFVATQNLMELWETWSDPELTELLRWLAPFVWVGQVRRALGEITRTECTAMSAVVLGTLQRAFLDSGRSIVARTQGLAITDRTGHPVSFLQDPWPGPALPAGMAAVLRATQGLTAHRLLRWLLHRAHHQAIAHATPDFRCVRVPGGLAGLARLLKMNGRKVCEELKMALQVFQHAHVELPTGEVGGLLTWTTQSEAPGRPAELRIVVGDALLPHYVHALPKGSRTRQRARMLVPIPPDLPPLIGHPRHHAGLARLQFLLMAEFRHQATQMYVDGWVRIESPRWTQLAEEAGVPREVIEDAVHTWADEKNEGAFLARSAADPCCWKLTDSRERLFIEEAGQQEQHARLRRNLSRKARGRGLARRAGQNSSRPSKPPAVEELNEW